MRHAKTARLMELARHLAGASMGLTLDEMAERLGVGRRTVERMRDQVEMLFPELEAISDPPVKRWRLPRGLDGFALSPSAEELAALGVAAREMAATHPQAAVDLAHLESKLLAALKAQSRRRLAPDIEALMQAEAFATRPGPRPRADSVMMAALRDALLGLRQVAFHYAGGSGPARRRVVAPYGVLFGGEIYLVARDADDPDTAEPRMWRVDRISELEVLDAPGGPPEGFSLQSWSERSFGVFQEPTVDVVLRVPPEHAPEARRFQFHPRQMLEELPDGGLLVRLHGGGLRELAWSLFRWGGKLEILKPEALKTVMRDTLAAAAGLAGPAAT